MAKRILSGIQPSGTPTLGNYIGAIKRWAENQDGNENIFPVVNLHAITVRQDPAELLESSLKTAAWLLAAGIDPQASILFIQSQVPAHSELAWILNNYVTFGELERMTQFKDKSRKLGPEGQLAGLFSYPVLMAADILLYDADAVPTAADQKQHLELTRDVASRFNNLYGPTFKLPEPTIGSAGKLIMNLQNPSAKMSKSDQQDGGVIYLDESAESVRSKIQRAVTDSGSAIAVADDKPAITNLVQIYSGLSNRSVEQIESDFAGRGYGAFKADLAELIVSCLAPLQQAQQQLSPDDLGRTLEQGRAKANSIAEAKINQVKTKIGLL